MQHLWVSFGPTQGAFDHYPTGPTNATVRRAALAAPLDPTGYVQDHPRPKVTRVS
jgi:hypothetical protein